MNQTFSLTRLAHLNSWFWAIKGRTYLIAAAAILILICLVLSGVLSMEKEFYQDIQRNNIVWFNFLAVAVVAIMSSDVFSLLFRQESAISYLMIPASGTEKYSLGVGYCILAIVLTGVFYFGYEAIVFSIANDRLPAKAAEHYTSSLKYVLVRTEANVLWAMAYAFLLAMGIGILGSLYFRRGVLARNVGVALGAMASISFLNYGIMKLFFSGLNVNSSLPFLSIGIQSKNIFMTLSSPQWLAISAYGLLLLAIWIITRIRFSEIER
jgi:hypothetical protein